MITTPNAHVLALVRACMSGGSVLRLSCGLVPLWRAFSVTSVASLGHSKCARATSAEWCAILTRAADKERFRNVAAAHKTLSVEDKRRRYGDFGDADGEAGRSVPIA